MSIRRRSTVHDLASLRLHPDGSRVQPSSSGERKTHSARGSTGGHRPSRNTGYDIHGNRIALDAGGSAAIKQHKGAASRDLEEVDGEASGRLEDVGRRSHRETDTVADPKEKSHPRRRTRRSSEAGESASSSDGVETVKGQRAKKRRKFYEDFPFLSGQDANPPGFVVPGLAPISDPVSPSQHVMRNRAALSQSSLPVPSSDLLKFVHHFASEYYATCGCLFNAPKEAREAVKLRRVVKLRKAIARKAGQRIIDDAISGVDSSEDSGIDDDGDEKDNGNKADRMEGSGRGPGREEGATGPRKRRKKGSKGSPRRDMYKAFDGSALMAIGMLIQEHAAEMLNAEVPENWLRQMETSQAEEMDGVRGKRSRREIKHEGNLEEMTQAEERNGSRLMEEVQDTVHSDDEDNATSDGISSESG